MSRFLATNGGRKAVAVIAAGTLAASGVGGLATSSAQEQGGGRSVVIDQVRYSDQLYAMWAAECFANWTGLTTEGARPNGPDLYGTRDPFFTDADWGAEGIGRGGATITWENPDPCGADDDTDIEYSYLNEMAEIAEDVKLTPEQVAHMWNTNVESYVWFSNSAADLLQLEGVRTPSTTLSAANQHRNIIDAQLTVEMFGALAPGRPDIALDIAQLPTRASAGGFATHAAQFNVVLYSLASVVPKDLSAEEQIRWLIDEARKYLPSESRSSEIIDWVTAEYDAHPDEPWESLRDKIYQRYQVDSVENGFNYLTKYESAINLAAQVAELLYGKGDLTRTVQIGTLFGWDSDNPTASNAGLIGLMKGALYVEQEFISEGIGLTQRYNAYRTRVNLPDYLPADDEATDTYRLMADRALPLVEQVVDAAGGTSSSTSFTIPLVSAPRDDRYSTLAKVNPDVEIYVRSGNNQVRNAGGAVRVTSNLVGDTSLYTTDTSGWPEGRMFPEPLNGDDISVVADGLDSDTRGLEEWERSPFFSGSSGAQAPMVTVSYGKKFTAESIRLIGGGIDGTGGWIDGATLEVKGVDGRWRQASFTPDTSIDPDQPFQQVDLELRRAEQITGFRVTFQPDAEHLNLTEVDAVGPSVLTFDGLD